VKVTRENLLLVTAWSYAAAAVLALSGWPAMEAIGNEVISPIFQACIYACLAALLAFSWTSRAPRWLLHALAGFYGASAGLSFMGIQRWISYADAGDLLGPAMAAWDLAVALALTKAAEAER